MDLVRATQPNREAIRSFSKVYKAALDALSGAITFSPEERLAKATADLFALEMAQKNQLESMWRTAPSTGYGKRTEARIKELYAKELVEIQGRIEDADREIAEQKK